MRRMIYLGYYLYRVPGLLRLARPLLRSRLAGLLRPLILMTYWRDIAFYGFPCGRPGGSTAPSPACSSKAWEASSANR